jgi:hypothetical protein
MNEIQPVLPSQSIRKPVKVTPEKDRNQRKNNNSSQQDTVDEPLLPDSLQQDGNIDETV